MKKKRVSRRGGVKRERFTIGQTVWFTNPNFPARHDRMTVISARIRWQHVWQHEAKWRYGYVCQLAATLTTTKPNDWTVEWVPFWETRLTANCPECAKGGTAA